MKLYEICFSPTGGTKKVTDMLAEEIRKDTVFIDLTDSRKDFSSIAFEEDSIAILAVPSYGGRVPAPAAERISAIRGNGTKAILICVYGNRAYEDTLVELQDTVKQAGFPVIAAVAAVAEHSIAHQFAAGRPDAQDQAELRAFAEKIQAKLEDKAGSEPSVPGNRPYKKSGVHGMIPTPTKNCVKCALCAEKCPVQAISPTDPKEVRNKNCISCMRCVAVCPHSARKVNDIMLADVNTILKKACAERKECELYI